MKLSSIFGLRSRLRQLRIAAGEGALAAKDRARLLQMAWEEEKQRLQLMLALAIVLIGLTTVTVSLISVAIVVHFWDTPNRVMAAWSVAGVWTALWILAAFALMATVRKASEVLEPARQEFERDWAWIQQRFHLGEEDEDGEAPKPKRPVTRDDLLARIATQRKRVETVAAPAPPKIAGRSAPPANESASAAAVRIARENPVAVGAAAAAVVAVFGPRRLLRWAAVVAPIVWRMR